jgi:NAD(P)-dependent dehydrogenase (short-subunit alcohol dehydrogenase family)
VLIHNAGALTHEYAAAPGGHEQTYTAQVLAPHLMTHRLLPLMPAGSRVVVVSSGGMYAEPLRPGAMETGEQGYDGVRAYARAKRCQVELVAQWARRYRDTGVVFAAMHPGWADTPGVRMSLPKFHRITRLALRDASQGADTVVWLAVAALPPGASGWFWHDRRPRRTSLLPGSSTDPRDADELWEQVQREAYDALARCGSRDQNSSRLSTT